jgi:hypothetical protein
MATWPGLNPTPTPPPKPAPSQPKVTYTPDGAARAPGYVNPSNPYDTGYHGQQNAEKGGGASKLPGWDYDNARPFNSSGVDANGMYTGLGGGGGGGGGTYSTAIPGASQYTQAALMAKRAYDTAVANITQKRQGTLTQYGYKGNVGANGQLTDFAVDPFNPYGQFQQMRRGNAMASQDLLSADQERGIGSGGGLAAQDQNNIRYGFGLADQAMGQGLMGDLSGYQSDLTGAAYTRDAALYEAELAAAQAAIDAGQFNPADYGGGGDSSGDTPGASGNWMDTLDPIAAGITGVDWFAAAKKAGINLFGKSSAKTKPKFLPPGPGAIGARTAPKPAPKPTFKAPGPGAIGSRILPPPKKKK